MTKNTMANKLPRKLTQKMQIVPWIVIHLGAKGQ